MEILLIDIENCRNIIFSKHLFYKIPNFLFLLFYSFIHLLNPKQFIFIYLYILNIIVNEFH